MAFAGRKYGVGVRVGVGIGEGRRGGDEIW